MPFKQDRPEVRASKVDKRDSKERNSHVHSNAEDFYTNAQAIKYTTESNKEIQRDMTNHCMEFLNIYGLLQNEASIILDIGAGSGLSSNAIANWLKVRQQQMFIIAFDVSAPMLALSFTTMNQIPYGNFCGNAAHSFPIRSNQIDAAISISMLQWLSKEQLEYFYNSLYNVLTPSGLAICQIYPTSQDQVDMMESMAYSIGFQKATVVVSFPHKTSAKKWYLCLHKVMPECEETNLQRNNELCLFGRRFHRCCSWNILKQAKTQEAIRERDRIGREHVKLVWHVWRKYGRSIIVMSNTKQGIINGRNALNTSTGTQLKEDRGRDKANQSLALWPSDISIGELVERFFANQQVSTNDITYQHLLSNMNEIVDLAHKAYTKAVVMEEIR